MKSVMEDWIEQYLRLKEASDILDELLVYITPYVQDINGIPLDENLKNRIREHYNFDDSE